MRETVALLYECSYLSGSLRVFCTVVLGLFYRNSIRTFQKSLTAQEQDSFNNVFEK